MAIAILAIESAARAQLDLKDVIDEGMDLLIQQSLGSFGHTVGAQLPIIVDHTAAYPTVKSLPGKPFASKGAPSLVRALRASKDGTALLPPGDYAFAVDVFCMRANAESPDGYQYRMAPLRGSAADIITALNARAPAYRIGHGVLQVLSWNIQAGVPYAGMAANERVAVDKVIPEFRNRMKGAASGGVSKTYAHLARTIPGMPGLDEALHRIGPIGTAMANLTTLQRQLAQHSQTFEELSRALVPRDSAAKPTTAVSRATPWSRYSQRVYVRFVTSGDFTTPGTYQVRVLAGPAASVPFTNVVADPGTDAVQPLTQTVRTSGPAPAPLPRPKATPAPKIISETYATVPGTVRSRTTVGVGEAVKLAFTGGVAHWEMDSHSLNPVEKLEEGHLTSHDDSATTYLAASDARTETIMAEGADHVKATITFNVIAPTGIRQVVDPQMPLIHTFDRPDIGYWAHTYLEPDRVSFEYLNVREGDVCPRATGVFVPLGEVPLSGHQPNPIPVPVIAVVQGLGSLVRGQDTIYSGLQENRGFSFPGGHPVYAPGFLNYHIPWYYVLASGGGSEHRFAVVDQNVQLDADGNTLTASKAGAGVSTTVLHLSVGLESLGRKESTKTITCP